MLLVIKTTSASLITAVHTAPLPAMLICILPPSSHERFMGWVRTIALFPRR